MKHLLAVIGIIFCCGIFFAGFINIPFWILYSLGIATLVLSWSSEKFNILLFCAIFLLGAASYKNAQSLPACDISRYVPYKSHSAYLIKGIVASQPEQKNNSATFIFASEEIQANNLNRSCCGNVFVHLSAKKVLRYGDELILEGSLLRPFSKTYRAYLSRQGINLILRLKNEAFVAPLNKNKGFIIKGFAFWLRNKTEGLISRHLSPVTSSILKAMVLGERKDIPPFVYNSMVKTGTVHILVVSGFNVGIVAFIILLFLKLIRLPRIARFYITIPCLVVYCLMTGASNPVLRSTIMAIVFMSAHLLKREPDIYNSVSIAALLILAFNPRQLFDIGFQLSFASVISIVYLYPKLKHLLRLELTKIKLFKFLLEGFLVSLSAWIGTMGFIAFNFKIFSPVTVLANIFIVPIATLITLCGLSLMLIAIILPPIAPFFALTSELTVAILLKLNILLVRLPYAYFCL